MTVIETDRLIIREYSEADIEDLFAIMSDPITMSFWPSPFTFDHVTDWVKRNIQNYHDLGFGRWAIILKETNQLIGDCGLMRTHIDGKLENDLGYIIDHKFWNRGYALEAVRACKNYAFAHLKLKRLCANMPIDHARSANVAIKIGMSQEKVFHNQKNRDLPTFLFSCGESSVQQ